MYLTVKPSGLQSILKSSSVNLILLIVTTCKGDNSDGMCVHVCRGYLMVYDPLPVCLLH